MSILWQSLNFKLPKSLPRTAKLTRETDREACRFSLQSPLRYRLRLTSANTSRVLIQGRFCNLEMQLQAPCSKTCKSRYNRNSSFSAHHWKLHRGAPCHCFVSSVTSTELTSSSIRNLRIAPKRWRGNRVRCTRFFTKFYFEEECYSWTARM